MLSLDIYLVIIYSSKIFGPENHFNASYGFFFSTGLLMAGGRMLKTILLKHFRVIVEWGRLLEISTNQA